MDLFAHNMNLREALATARKLGVIAYVAKGTGDYIFKHPAYHKSIRANCRRKDAPRAVIVMLRAVSSSRP